MFNFAKKQKNKSTHNTKEKQKDVQDKDDCPMCKVPPEVIEQLTTKDVSTKEKEKL